MNPRLIKQRILVIGNDARGVQALQCALEANGTEASYAFISCGHTYAMGRLVENFVPHVIIFHLHEAGRDLIEILRELPTDNVAPFIFVSEHADDSTIKAAISFTENEGFSVAAVIDSFDDASELVSTQQRAIAESDKSIEEELKHAIQNGQIIPYYQPIVEARSGRVLGIEALARWEHPSDGTRTPAQFLPMTERLGLMDDLTVKMAEQVVTDQRDFRDTGFELVASLNVAPSMLRSATNAINLRATFRQEKLLDAFAFELTETEPIVQSRPLSENLAEIRLSGFGLYLDDFGTGHSSLSALLDTPFSELKIDRRFVSNMVEDQNSAVIVDGAIKIAQAMERRTCAEGVETDGALDRLNDMHCDHVQGFLFSKPLRKDGFTQWMKGRSVVPKENRH
ncbi:MAG: EAL domain-containing protein [Acetobacterales bacterium]